MKRILSLIISLCILLTFTIGSLALEVPGAVKVQLVSTDPTWSGIGLQKVTHFDSLEKALAAAVNGDVIEVFENISLSAPITIPSGLTVTIVSGTKVEEGTHFGASTFVKTDPDAVTRTVSQTFDGSMFTVEEGATLNMENITLKGKENNTADKGGLIYVESGAEVNLSRGVTLKDSTLAGSGTMGGAIYVEAESTVNVEDTVFSGNGAKKGGDIYAEDKESLTVAEGVTANVYYYDPDAADYILGDVNDDGKVNDQDAIYLLFNATFGDEYYPLNQDGDFNGDGEVNDQDAIYLLFYCFYPDLYPLG